MAKYINREIADVIKEAYRYLPNINDYRATSVGQNYTDTAFVS